MGSVKSLKIFAVLSLVFLCTLQVATAKPLGKRGSSDTGFLEIECNIEGLELYLCPRERYETKKKEVLFGLIKSEKRVCSGNEIPVGETPVKPVSVPAGKYILLVPSGYHVAHEGPLEIDINKGKRTFFLLKLFSPRGSGDGEDYGAGAGGGAGGGSSR